MTFEKPDELIEKENNIREKILNIIKDGNLFGNSEQSSPYYKISKIYEVISDDEDIKELLKKSYKSTAVENYINRHGRLHGLRTAKFSLEIFKLIKDDIVESSYLSYIDEESNLNESYILLSMLLSAYIHDTGRFYAEVDHEERIEDALNELDLKMEALYNLKRDLFISDFLDSEWKKVRRWIKELCLSHDKKRKKSDKVETGIIKLADALHCSEERCYSSEDKETLERKSREQKIKTIFHEDRFPEKFFGCKAVKAMDVQYKERKGKIECRIGSKELNMDNLAISIPLKRVLETLGALSKSKEKVNALAESVVLLASQWRDGEWTEGEAVLFPEEVSRTYGARINNFRSKYKIKENGDAEFEDVISIENVGPLKEIRSHPFFLVHDEPVSWDAIDVYAKNLDTDNELEIHSDYPRVGEEESKEHRFFIIFDDPIKRGDKIKLEKGGELKRFFLEDRIFYKAYTPVQKFKRTLKFLNSKSKEELCPVRLIVDNENDNTVLSKKINHCVEEKDDDITKIELELDELKPRYKYSIDWAS